MSRPKEPNPKEPNKSTQKDILKIVRKRLKEEKKLSKHCVYHVIKMSGSPIAFGQASVTATECDKPEKAAEQCFNNMYETHKTLAKELSDERKRKCENFCQNAESGIIMHILRRPKNQVVARSFKTCDECKVYKFKVIKPTRGRTRVERL